MEKIISDIDLSVNLNGFVIKNPIMTASGTFGYVDEYSDYMDERNLGAIVTKAVTLFPREGNFHTRIFEVKSGLINSIGLENIGIHKFIEEKLPVLKGKNVEFIVNIAGSTPEEYIELAKICSKKDIKAIELNISCPNVKAGCLEFGINETVLTNLIKAVRQEFNGCLIVKLTPNVTSIEKIAAAAQKAGADVLTAINTVKAAGLKLDYTNGKFIKKDMIQGGLSGAAIKPIALSAVLRLKKAVDIPLIASGGISSLEDVFEFFAVGAEAVQIGTANFTHPDISEKIVFEMIDFMKIHNIDNISQLKRELREALNE